jgi:hypothetical protein
MAAGKSRAKSKAARPPTVTAYLPLEEFPDTYN